MEVIRCGSLILASYPEYIPEYIDKTHGCGEITWSPDGNSIIFAFGIGEDISQQIHTLYLLTLETTSNGTSNYHRINLFLLPTAMVDRVDALMGHMMER